MMIPMKELGDVKVGDMVEMRVASITDGMALLKPCSDMEAPEEEMSEEMPTEDEARSMPMDKLEKRLPKAERE